MSFLFISLSFYYKYQCFSQKNFHIYYKSISITDIDIKLTIAILMENWESHIILRDRKNYMVIKIFILKLYTMIYSKNRKEMFSVEQWLI